MPELDLKLVEDSHIRVNVDIDVIQDMIEDECITPEDIFTEEELATWATQNGYSKI